MTSLKPHLDKIDLYKFYNLSEKYWKIDASDASIKFNKPILQNIALDFSNFTGIEYNSIIKIFGRYILGKSSEHLLLLYTNKGSENIFFYFTHYYTETYEGLNPE